MSGMSCFVACLSHDYIINKTLKSKEDTENKHYHSFIRYGITINTFPHSLFLFRKRKKEIKTLTPSKTFILCYSFSFSLFAMASQPISIATFAVALLLALFFAAASAATPAATSPAASPEAGGAAATGGSAAAGGTAAAGGPGGAEAPEAAAAARVVANSVAVVGASIVVSMLAIFKH